MNPKTLLFVLATAVFCWNNSALADDTGTNVREGLPCGSGIEKRRGQYTRRLLSLFGEDGISAIDMKGHRVGHVQRMRREGVTMAKILAVATHATDDPTKAAFAFLTAIGAIGGGKEVSIALLGEAAYLAKEAVRKNIHGVGFPPLSEIVDQVVTAKIPVYV